MNASFLLFRLPLKRPSFRPCPHRKMKDSTNIQGTFYHSPSSNPLIRCLASGLVGSANQILLAACAGVKVDCWFALGLEMPSTKYNQSRAQRNLLGKNHLSIKTRLSTTIQNSSTYKTPNLTQKKLLSSSHEPQTSPKKTKT